MQENCSRVKKGSKKPKVLTSFLIMQQKVTRPQTVCYAKIKKKTACSIQTRTGSIKYSFLCLRSIDYFKHKICLTLFRLIFNYVILYFFARVHFQFKNRQIMMYCICIDKEHINTIHIHTCQNLPSIINVGRR